MAVPALATVAVLGLYGAGKGLQMAAERDAKVQAKKKKPKVEENNDNKMKLSGLELIFLLVLLLYYIF